METIMNTASNEAEQFDEMQARLLGENGNDIFLEMMDNAIALNVVLRETFDELNRRSERKIARRVIRAMLLSIESEIWNGMIATTAQEQG